jgi:hypothetical protein
MDRIQREAKRMSSAARNLLFDAAAIAFIAVLIVWNRIPKPR